MKSIFTLSDSGKKESAIRRRCKALAFYRKGDEEAVRAHDREQNKVIAFVISKCKKADEELLAQLCEPAVSTYKAVDAILTKRLGDAILSLHQVYLYERYNYKHLTFEPPKKRDAATLEIPLEDEVKCNFPKPPGVQQGTQGLVCQYCHFVLSVEEARDGKKWRFVSLLLL